MSVVTTYCTLIYRSSCLLRGEFYGFESDLSKLIPISTSYEPQNILVGSSLKILHFYNKKGSQRTSGPNETFALQRIKRTLLSSRMIKKKTKNQTHCKDQSTYHFAS
jgi:hypothetical protein